VTWIFKDTLIDVSFTVGEVSQEMLI